VKLDLETFKLRASGVYSRPTLERKLVALRQYGAFLSERGLEPGLESLRAWLDELGRRGASPRTVGAYGRDVLTYFDFMLLELDEGRRRLLRRTLPPVYVGRPEFLTEEEVARLVEAASSPTYRLIYILMYAYARRLGEVLALRRGDVDLEAGTITFPILKKKVKEVATFELEPTIRALLAEHMRRARGERLFDVTERAVEVAFKRDCGAAGIEPRGRRLRPHLLRHSRVTHLVDAGVPVETVSKVLARHANVSTTAGFYLGVTERMRASIPPAGEVLRIGGRREAGRG